MKKELIGDIQKELGREIGFITEKYYDLKSEEAFILWFVREHILDPRDYSKANLCLTGASGDKSIDAIVVDDEYKKIHLVQGKYHKPLLKGSESRSGIMDFVGLADLPDRPAESLADFYNKLEPSVQSRLPDIIEKVKRGYTFSLCYITTKKVSETIVRDAQRRAFDLRDGTRLHIYGGEWVITKFKDFLIGAAPGIPVLDLKIAASEGTKSEGKIYRFDKRTKIETHIFSMLASDVGELYRKNGDRLFSRNIRGYVGHGDSKSINHAIREAAEKDPDNFWYYNNGITLICNRAELKTEKGKDCLHVYEPSIINGQQTTRSLAVSGSTRANVLVRAIVVPLSSIEESDRYNTFINHIVSATNRQNAIKTSDLVSNDQKQVLLERVLRAEGYLYQRKRRSGAEEKILFGPGFTKISKEFLGKIEAAIMFGPYAVKSTEAIFENDFYDDLFNKEDAKYYLSRFWLMEQIKVNVTKTEMTRANWCVLAFIWRLFNPALDSKKIANQFVTACRKKDKKILAPLGRAISSVFKCAEDFYKSSNRKQETDIRSFFVDKNVVNDFEKFWNTKGKSRRKLADEELKEFMDRLLAVPFVR